MRQNSAIVTQNHGRRRWHIVVASSSDISEAAPRHTPYCVTIYAAVHRGLHVHGSHYKCFYTSVGWFPSGLLVAAAGDAAALVIPPLIMQLILIYYLPVFENSIWLSRLSPAISGIAVSCVAPVKFSSCLFYRFKLGNRSADITRLWGLHPLRQWCPGPSAARTHSVTVW